MSRISNVFGKSGRKALISYVTAGYPDADATLKAVPLLAESGSDIIELGIPFSDPLADGVTIQNSSYHALRNGITPARCLEIAGELRKKVETPLVFMTYYNPVFSYGIDRFCKDCSDTGIDGLIIPDLPPEEGDEIDECSEQHGIDLIYLLAPTSNEERIELAAGKSRGFIYLVSLTGVTGAREILPADLKSFILKVRKVTDKPLCVGFGISTPDQAGQVAEMADGVIIGSRIVQYMESDGSYSDLSGFIHDIRQVLDRKTGE